MVCVITRDTNGKRHFYGSYEEIVKRHFSDCEEEEILYVAEHIGGVPVCLYSALGKTEEQTITFEDLIGFLA